MGEEVILKQAGLTGIEFEQDSNDNLKKLDQQKQDLLMDYIKEKYEVALNYEMKGSSPLGKPIYSDTLKEGEIHFGEILKFLDGTKHTNPY